MAPEESVGAPLRIATWNLQRPRLTSTRRIPGQFARIAATNAGVWILTETSNAIDLSPTHRHHVASSPLDRPGDTKENWSTVWSCFPLTQIPTDDPLTVCADVETPGRSTIVFGTALPYTGDPGPDGTAKGWSEFLRVVALQGAEWRRLRAEYPDHRFCLAGDFNQSRDRRRWNGREWCATNATRDALDTALGTADLVCVTEQDFIATGQLTTRSSFVRVALDAGSAAAVLAAGAWEAGAADDGRRLSDHNGVWAELSVDA